MKKVKKLPTTKKGKKKAGKANKGLKQQSHNKMTATTTHKSNNCKQQQKMHQHQHEAANALKTYTCKSTPNMHDHPFFLKHRVNASTAVMSAKLYDCKRGRTPLEACAGRIQSSHAPRIRLALGYLAHSLGFKP